MTQVRQNPAVTENRRDTVEGLNRRISCIHRMYSSRCGLLAASGSRPLGAPGQVAAQVRFGVLTGGAFEAGQVGGHRQPQLVSEWRRKIGGC
jgi:hypothetical protein